MLIPLQNLTVFLKTEKNRSGFRTLETVLPHTVTSKRKRSRGAVFLALLCHFRLSSMSDSSTTQPSERIIALFNEFRQNEVAIEQLKMSLIRQGRDNEIIDRQIQSTRENVGRMESEHHQLQKVLVNLRKILRSNASTLVCTRRWRMKTSGPRLLKNRFRRKSKCSFPHTHPCRTLRVFQRQMCSLFYSHNCTFKQRTSRISRACVWHIARTLPER